MRFISGAIVGVVLATSMTYVATGAAQADDIVAPRATAGAVDVSSTTVPAAPQALSTASDGSDLVAELPARGTDEFGLVGVTWDSGFDATGMLVEVRLRTKGAWGSWEELHIEGVDDTEGGRPGTEPLWVGAADGVAVKVTSPTGQRPAGLKVDTIDAGATPSDPTSASAAVYRTSSAGAVTTAATTAQPPIILRSAWGAAPNTKCDTPTVSSGIMGAVVHHTAGTNSYTADQSAQIVRATQAYHMKSRKWCDIGYNFLVDKYGQIFEGRNGGIDRAVRAAHSGNAAVNTYTMGVSMMGTFDKSAPTQATKDAVAKLISWRFGLAGIPATGTYSLGGKTLNRIAGHRDVVGTECPGAAAYAWLSAPGGLRATVASGVAAASSPVAQLASRLGVSKTGSLVAAEYPFYTAPKGTKARYRKLDIISSRFGTYAVKDVVRSRYKSRGAQSGALGVPTSAQKKSPRSQVQLQRFHYGTIYRVKRKNKPLTTVALYGRLENKYISRGELRGKLGVPTKTQRKISGGRERAYFTKGTLTLEANGRVTVSVK
ncbi:MAG: peptidoglycan recognition protein [Aeromicrobium sp.]